MRTATKANYSAILDQAHQHFKMLVVVPGKECKEVKSESAVTTLVPSENYFRTVPQFMATPSSDSFLKLFRSFLSPKMAYPFRIGTALNMSSSAGGIVNSTINNATLQSVTDFTALAAVFQEFFVKSLTVSWMPVSRYQYPLTGVVATSVANLPIGVANLFHSAAAYTSLTQMANNQFLQFKSTGDPFVHTWVNDESSSVTGPLPITTFTQSWCDTVTGGYLGTIQVMSQSAPPGIVASSVLGTFVAEWDVLFRIRA
jgi:hypothetical protein